MFEPRSSPVAVIRTVATPVVGTIPPVEARPKAWVAWSKSSHVCAGHASAAGGGQRVVDQEPEGKYQALIGSLRFCGPVALLQVLQPIRAALFAHNRCINPAMIAAPSAPPPTHR